MSGSNGANIPVDLEGQEIRIIGPRFSGKSTYLAALAYYGTLGDRTVIKSIDPFNEETAELVRYAEDFLKQAKPLAGTDFNRTPDLYTFIITLKPSFRNHPLLSVRQKEIRLNVSCSEYAGELINTLRDPQRAENETLKNYLNDIAEATGLMILLDPKSNPSDRQYAEGFRVLQQELNDRITYSSGRALNAFRLAIVFTKAETAWASRENVEQYMGLKFPQSKQIFTQWQKTWNCSISYFFCSAFGMKGTPPRPNITVIRRDQDGVKAVIASPDIWQPWGLVAPLYWLQTGKIDPKLREI